MDSNIMLEGEVIAYVDYNTKRKLPEDMDSGRDYDIKLVVKKSDKTFFVLKYYRFDDNEIFVKSLKNWYGITMAEYWKHASSKIPGTKQGLSISEWFKKYPVEGDDIMSKTLSFVKDLPPFERYKLIGSYDDETLDDKEDTTYRLAFESDTDMFYEMNMIIKVWTNPKGILKYTHKFDNLEIDKQAKQWTMVASEVNNQIIQYFEKINIATFDSKLTIGDSKPYNVSQTTRDDLTNTFVFKGSKTSYFIDSTRAVVVIDIHATSSYCYWVVEGGEDHRMIVSAKGPFDPTLNMNETETWVQNMVTEEYFFLQTGHDKKTLKALYAPYSVIWMQNLNKVWIAGSKLKAQE